jgi:hypothetical protein
MCVQKNERREVFAKSAPLGVTDKKREEEEGG